MAKTYLQFEVTMEHRNALDYYERIMYCDPQQVMMSCAAYRICRGCSLFAFVCFCQWFLLQQELPFFFDIFKWTKTITYLEFIFPFKIIIEIFV